MQVKYLKRNVHNDRKRNHLRMQNKMIISPLVKGERIVKEESFRGQRPIRWFEAAGCGAAQEQKTLSNTRKHEEPLLKDVLLRQQRLAWTKRNHLKWSENTVSYTFPQSLDRVSILVNLLT